MDTNKITPGIWDRIAAEMVAAGISKRALSISSGVPLTTLDHKLRTANGDFTAREMATITNALGVPFVRLLPDEVRTEVHLTAA